MVLGCSFAYYLAHVLFGLLLLGLLQFCFLDLYSLPFRSVEVEKFEHSCSYA